MTDTADKAAGAGDRCRDHNLAVQDPRGILLSTNRWQAGDLAGGIDQAELQILHLFTGEVPIRDKEYIPLPVWD